MSYSYMPLNMNLIPESTKNNIPTFWGGTFSSDNTRKIEPGYHSDGTIAHDITTLLAWLQWEVDPQATLNLILEEAKQHEMTKEQFQEAKNNVNSIWYIQPEVEL